MAVPTSLTVVPGSSCSMRAVSSAKSWGGRAFSLPRLHRVPAIVFRVRVSEKLPSIDMLSLESDKFLTKRLPPAKRLVLQCCSAADGIDAHVLRIPKACKCDLRTKVRCKLVRCVPSCDTDTRKGGSSFLSTATLTTRRTVRPTSRLQVSIGLKSAASTTARSATRSSRCSSTWHMPALCKSRTPSQHREQHRQEECVHADEHGARKSRLPRTCSPVSAQIDIARPCGVKSSSLQHKHGLADACCYCSSSAGAAAAVLVPPGCASSHLTHLSATADGSAAARSSPGGCCNTASPYSRLHRDCALKSSMLRAACKACHARAGITCLASFCISSKVHHAVCFMKICSAPSRTCVTMAATSASAGCCRRPKLQIRLAIPCKAHM